MGTLENRAWRERLIMESRALRPRLQTSAAGSIYSSSPPLSPNGSPAGSRRRVPPGSYAALMDARLKAIGATASLPHSTSLPALRPPAGEPLPNIFDPIGRPQKQETFLAMRARTETREPRAAIQSAYEQQQYIEPRRVFSNYLVEASRSSNFLYSPCVTTVVP